jgi:hypothetical protein
MVIDWPRIDREWGDILKQAREDVRFHQCTAFDDCGNIVTTNRPMIESFLADKVAKRERTQFYLELLGFRPRKGRVITLACRSRMPVGTGGGGKVQKGKKK